MGDEDDLQDPSQTMLFPVLYDSKTQVALLLLRRFSEPRPVLGFLDTFLRIFRIDFRPIFSFYLTARNGTLKLSYAQSQAEKGKLG